MLWKWFMVNGKNVIGLSMMDMVNVSTTQKQHCVVPTVAMLLRKNCYGKTTTAQTVVLI